MCSKDQMNKETGAERRAKGRKEWEKGKKKWSKTVDDIVKGEKKMGAKMMSDESIDKAVDQLLEQPDEYPDECYNCGKVKKAGEAGWKTVTMDLDPGDREVGPQPDIQEVGLCPSCAQKE